MSPASYQTAPPRVAMESGKRDSNPRPQPWQGCALPTELFPRASANLTAQWGSVYRPPPPATRPAALFRPCRPFSGGEGDRTPDLVNAIHALSQLSYAPVILGPAKPVPAGTRHLIGTLWRCQAFSCPHANFSACVRYHRLIRE